jgi:electron transfer flavoprotein alpha subunit
VALVPVRNGVLPLGAAEATSEAGGHCWLLGSGCQDALTELPSATGSVRISEIGRFEPARWAALLSPALAADPGHLLVPASPDGRDLAPRLAAALDRPLVTGVTELSGRRAVVTRHGDRVMETLALSAPVVAVLQLGIRSVATGASQSQFTEVDLMAATSGSDGTSGPDAGMAGGGHVQPLADIPAAPATVDLAEAHRIVAGGAGLGSEDRIDLLTEVAERLGASVGATRVVTDLGWLPPERQIGTTGALIDPELYIAVGISGAVQHTAGLGSPRHIVSVNTDPSCPMMELADLALLCDGPAFLEALVDELDRRA